MSPVQMFLFTLVFATIIPFASAQIEMIICTVLRLLFGFIFGCPSPTPICQLGRIVLGAFNCTRRAETLHVAFS
ncbi:hypothetical protein PoB_001440100 [Plakobranchus ocellatus]|uniref:Secreted protein n=1 Tax=Plakobranchus ocellatus TaxID=259542 RepID=A0AAV3YZY6_9GAST|nr:hypothetical protein PoB_001440100 [Plakobranchus ocellatus]